MQGLICQIMLIWNYFVIFSFNYATTEKLYRETKFTIEVKGHYTDTLIESLQTHDFSLLHKITPSVYIFKYKGEKEDAIKRAMKAFPDQIKEIEKIRIYKNNLRPEQTESKVMVNADFSKYFDIGIPTVWARNITGKGVIIAINDVGVNTDLLDLEININKLLSKNFFTNTLDVTPESFHALLDKPFPIADHGNRVASVIAAVKGKVICGKGIAVDTTIVALKSFEIKIKKSHPEQITASDVISRSLTYKLDIIDIFVNTIIMIDLFDQLDLAFRKALEHGATKGRRGLGTIYVVPAGPCGNGLSHNNNTISVNSIGINGTQSGDSYLDTSVLISGLHDGNSLTASSLVFDNVTASYGNKCSTVFKGTSVAVSQVSAIIALALQAKYGHVYTLKTSN